MTANLCFVLCLLSRWLRAYDLSSYNSQTAKRDCDVDSLNEIVPTLVSTPSVILDRTFLFFAKSLSQMLPRYFYR
jgi:hypothetical protein